MVLKTRKPTGAIPPPVILVEGDEGAGKSWTAATLSASAKVGRTLWMELGKESTADQYGAIPGSDYEIVRPDSPSGEEVWDWHALYRAACDIHAEGVRARNAGELPVVWVVDVIGAIWDFLSEWADNRARSARKTADELVKDPNFEYIVQHSHWNPAIDRWKAFMTKVLTFPGIVILLSHGQEQTLFEGGKATNRKTWKVEGHRSMTSNVPIWVRMQRGVNPKLIKFRSVINGLDENQKARPLPGFTLEKLIFETLGWDPKNSGYRTLTPMVAGSDAPPTETSLVLETAIESAEDMGQLTRAFSRVKPAHDEQRITDQEFSHLSGLALRLRAAMDPQQAARPVSAPPAQTNGGEPAIVGAAR